MTEREMRNLGTLPLFAGDVEAEPDPKEEATQRADSSNIARVGGSEKEGGTTTLRERDLAMFAGIGVSVDLLREAGVVRVTDRQARETFGIIGPLSCDMSGLVFPYRSHVTGNRVTARLRRDNPEIDAEGKAQRKYISAYGDQRHLFFPPDAKEKLADPATPIVLVEAEKSALAISAWSERTGRSILPVATGGCWSWRGKIGREEAPEGGWKDVKGPLPDLGVCDGRSVFVMPDANVSTNLNVRAARNALVDELRTRAAVVKICDIPQAVEGINGPDDLLGVCGDDALARVIDQARAVTASCVYGGGHFEIRDGDGVYYAPAPEGEDDEPREPIWLCSPLYVVAMTRDGKGNEWGRQLKWCDKDGVQHQWAMPLDLLQRDGGTEMRCELARQGLSISPGRTARDLLATYIQVWPVDARARCVDRLGWHGAMYVLPGKAIGHADEQVVFQNAHAVEPAFSISGTVEDWQRDVAAHAVGNSRLVFSICTALAGPLLEAAGEDAGGFHLRGPSSTGKTTLLRAAASVWGNPDKYCRGWRATTNGLEGLAALHNDGLLVLDELSQIDPGEAGEAAYLLANGQGKSRASRAGTARQAASWRVLFLSSGEESLSALMARAGKKSTAGQEIRMAEIEADAGAGMGVIEDLHGFANSAELVTAIREGTAKYHGAVGAAWLPLLVDERRNLRNFVTDGIQRFVAEHVPSGASGQIVRVGRRFALLAVAGELASYDGLTGWREGEATEAVAKCFESWMQLFGGVENREERSLYAQVRGFFESHGASRFQNENDVDQRVINRAGFVRDAGDGTKEFLVLPEAFGSEVCRGFDRRWAVKMLLARGLLVPGNDGRATQKPRFPGIGTVRVYVFGSKMWEKEE